MKQTKVTLCYGWIDLIVFCLVLLWLGLLTYLFLDQQPLPSTIWYHQLSRESIAQGEGNILIAYWIFGSLLVSFGCLHLYLACLICANALICAKNKLNRLNQQWSSPFVDQVCYSLVVCLGLLVPFLLAFYLSRKNKPSAFSDEVRLPIKVNRSLRRNKLILVTSCLLVLLVNASFIGLPLAMVYFHQTKPYYNHANAKRFYQLSQTGNNCLYFHFSGVSGSEVEQLLQANPRLKNAFKDFTLYQNHLSFSNQTLTSLPTAMFGYNGLIAEKQNITSPINHLMVKSLNQTGTIDFPGSCLTSISQLALNQYYKLCLANFIAFWHYLDYEIVNICGFPYYDKQNPWLTYPNNTEAMNAQMRHQYGFKNFTGVCASELLTYKQQKVHGNDLDDVNVIRQLSNDWEISNNYRSAFWAIYSSPHENVPASKNLPSSIADTFNDLSQIIQKLKEQDIYQNTSIVITSDRGSKRKEELSKNHKKFVENYAPIFMVKINQTSQSKLVINNQALITNADQLAFLRNLLYPDWKPDSFDPLNPFHRFKENYPFFDLYQPTNIYHTPASWNRQLSLFQPLDHRYLWWRKKIQTSEINHFSYHQSNQKSIFDNRNWIKEKIT